MRRDGPLGTLAAAVAHADAETPLSRAAGPPPPGTTVLAIGEEGDLEEIARRWSSEHGVRVMVTDAAAGRARLIRARGVASSTADRLAVSARLVPDRLPRSRGAGDRHLEDGRDARRRRPESRGVDDHARRRSGLDLVLGALLAVAIIFLFLRDPRATFISALALPTSVIGTFAFINIMGFTVNMMTTLALSLSIGILIDDAIGLPFLESLPLGHVADRG